MNFKIKAFCCRAKLGFSQLSIQSKKLLKSATIQKKVVIDYFTIFLKVSKQVGKIDLQRCQFTSSAGKELAPARCFFYLSSILMYLFDFHNKLKDSHQGNLFNVYSIALKLTILRIITYMPTLLLNNTYVQQIDVLNSSKVFHSRIHIEKMVYQQLLKPSTKASIVL